jgi:translation initiation factor IF-1
MKLFIACIPIYNQFCIKKQSTMPPKRGKGKGGKPTGGAKFSGNFMTKTEKEHMYACVTGKYGNGRFAVHALDGHKRTMTVGGKFKGRKKRANFVDIGTWVLVGDFSWDIEAGKSVEGRKCTLEYVYSPEEKKQLMKQYDEPWHILTNADPARLIAAGSSVSVSAVKDDIYFTSERDEELMALQNAVVDKAAILGKESISSSATKKMLSQKDLDDCSDAAAAFADGIIDIDDI